MSDEPKPRLKTRLYLVASGIGFGVAIALANHPSWQRVGRITELPRESPQSLEWRHERIQQPRSFDRCGPISLAALADSRRACSRASGDAVSSATPATTERTDAIRDAF
jgi:hypothetical protein